MIFRHPQEYIKLENCRFSVWTKNWPFRTVRENVEKDKLSYSRRQCKHTAAMPGMGWALERPLLSQAASFPQTAIQTAGQWQQPVLVSDRKRGSTQHPSTWGEADIFCLRTVCAAQQREDSIDIPFLPHCRHFKGKNIEEEISDRDRQICRAKEGYENELKTS